jgi:phage terminase large subunit-like protein
VTDTESLGVDRATAYAQAVISGEIVAGPHVRDTCKRHLDDLEHAHERGYYYDPDAAAEAIAFFEEVLCLNGGQFEGLPFLLLPWQSFIVGSLFGWKRVSDDCRRFRVAYIETGKGSGKSPLAAGVGLKGLVADEEPRAEVYAAATHRDQAKVLFRDALAFFDQSPLLNDRLVASGIGDNRWNLAYLEKGAFFRVISSENKGKSGPRPHFCLLDEVHEHRTADVIEMLRAGFKFRRQPLSFMITNSGHDKTSVCWEYHEMGCKIAAQTLENDEFFSYICALDEGDEPFEDESCWIKANPSLDAGIPGYDYLRGQVREAQGMPSKESVVKRVNFCIWTEADNPWISGDVWQACGDPDFDEQLLAGRTCTGGLDLSSTTDLTALALLFEPIPEDPVHRLKVYFWIPGHALKQREDRDRVPYIAWRDAGHLTATDGKAVNKLAVLHELAGITERYNVKCIAYDRWRIEDLKMLAANDGIDIIIGTYNDKLDVWEFNGDGIPMIGFGQGFKEMAPALDKFEELLLNVQVKHEGNPVLTWNAANAVTDSDPANNRKIAKNKATGRVDGIVAAVMASGIGSMKTEGESVYESRGLITL